jgi:type I restriction enzyme, S subunit
MNDRLKMQNNFVKLLNNTVVEWKALGEIAEIANNTRKPVKASLRTRGDVPYYGANNIQDYVDGYTHHGEFVLIAEDGSASLKNYSIQWATGKFWANNHVHIVRSKPELSNRFLYHYLCYMDFIPYLTGGDRAKLTKSKLIDIIVPIPPLHIQTEIVRILDTFTALTAELTAELTTRKKQYNYYRDKLLSFKDDEVEWKLIDEITTLKRGIRVVRNELSPKASYKVYQNSLTPLGYYEKTNTKENTTFIISAGAAGEIGYSPEVFWAADDCFYFECSNHILSRYLFHVLKNKQKYISSQVRRSSIPRLPRLVIEKLKIPIPPLKEQARIVEILDKFDTLTNSITEGLPREIELRQKQYEYYRNLLLDFPKD